MRRPVAPRKPNLWRSAVCPPPSARIWLSILFLLSPASAGAQQADPVVEDPLLQLAGMQLGDPPLTSNFGPAPPVRGGLSPALRATVDALGASSGVPDGAGLSWYPSVPVGNQAARMGLVNYQLGGTTPVSSTDQGGWYANGAARLLSVRTTAILPTDRVKFPGQFWDIQTGGSYLSQLSGGWSWGALLNFGTASDRPFHSLAEATVSALAFVRMPDGERNGWLFFVVSTTNGQIGHNIPIPGVAYEYVAERLHAVVGFPFLTIDYRPTREIQFEFNYAAVTEVLMRLSYHLTDPARVFIGYEWTNQAWFRADRPRSFDQFFMYEMRAECGFGWKTPGAIDFRVSGGYAFDRFFVENGGLGFSGRNRVNLAPGPFLAAQVELKF